MRSTSARPAVPQSPESPAPGGKMKLKIRSKGKKKRKLNRTGKVKVQGNVTYTPTGGEPNTEAKQIKLVKRL
jgi:hypothetical protein